MIYFMGGFSSAFGCAKRGSSRTDSPRTSGTIPSRWVSSGDFFPASESSSPVLLNVSANFFVVELFPRLAFLGDEPRGLLRFEPRPDAGVLGEAAPPEGGGVLSEVERRL